MGSSSCCPPRPRKERCFWPRLTPETPISVATICTTLKGNIAIAIPGDPLFPGGCHGLACSSDAESGSATCHAFGRPRHHHGVRFRRRRSLLHEHGCNLAAATFDNVAQRRPAQSPLELTPCVRLERFTEIADRKSVV